MSPQTKNKVDGTLNWVFRSLAIYFLITINGKLNSIDEIRRKQDVHEVRISTLEYNQKNLLLWKDAVNQSAFFRQGKPTP